jgi:hypothetical protein
MFTSFQNLFKVMGGPGQKKPGLKLINPGISLFYPQDLDGILLSAKRYALYGSSRSSDSRIILLAVPSHSLEQWFNTAFVPDHSGGPVPDFNGVPY